MGNKFIRNYIAKQVAGRSDDGIMISLRDPQKVEFQTAMMEDFLMRNGIDPRAIQSEEQLKMILNQISTINQPTSGIRGTESAKIFNRMGEELDPNQPIIGGTQPGKSIDTDTFSRLAETNTQRMKQKIADKKIEEDFDLEKGLDDLDNFRVTKDAARAKELIDAERIKEAELKIKFEKQNKEAAERFKEKQKQTMDDMKEIEDPEDFAKGGRAGFGGGGTMGASDRGYQGGGRDKEGNVSGDAPGAAKGGPGDGPDDRGNDRQNAVQAMVRAGFTPKEINRITNPSTLDKIRDSRFNNPITRGILRTGLYTLNPAIGGLEFRKAAQLKNFYDVIKSELDAPVEEEDLTLGGIGGENMADGGRAGFMAGGMSRRAFLKLMGGTGATIGAAKSGIFSGFGKGAGKEVAKEVVQQSATTPPPYFFKLAEKIKMLGDNATATSDRTIAKTLKSKDGKSTYVLEEDVTSGDTIIKKVNKEGDELITDVEIMEFKKGEIVKGKDGKAMKTPDEYEEVTEANARIEGDVFNDPYYTDGIQVDEIMKEVSEQAPSIKKAGGGIARMLGE